MVTFGLLHPILSRLKYNELTSTKSTRIVEIFKQKNEGFNYQLKPSIGMVMGCM